MGVNPDVSTILSSGFFYLIFLVLILRIFRKQKISKFILIALLTLLTWPFVGYEIIKKPQVEIQLIGVGVRPDASELMFYLKNNTKRTLPEDADIWLGIFGKDRISWLKTQNMIQIKPYGGIERFSVRYESNKSMFVISKVVSETLKNGVSLDDGHVAFTWDYWKQKPLSWSWWPKYSSSTGGDNKRIDRLLKILNDCVDSHLADRHYSGCFTGNSE